MILQLTALLPTLLLFAAVTLHMRAQAFRRGTMLLVLASLGLSYCHFYTSSYGDYTIDYEAHQEYIAFLLKHHRLPEPLDGAGGAARHPPAFYIAAAAMYALAEHIGLADPMQFARHVPMVFYTMFLVLGVHLLRLLLMEESMAFIGSLLIFLFWPIGITMGGRVSCDILLYTGQMGVLYGLVVWQKEKTPERLTVPFFWSGIAVLGKNGGVQMLAISCLVFLFTAYKHRGNLRAMLRADLAASMAFAFFSMAATLRHGWIITHVDQLFGYYPAYLLHLLSSFNVFVFLYEQNMGLAQDSFWNMWLHTLLLGKLHVPWKYDSLLMVFKVIWMMMLFYGIEGLIKYRKIFTPFEKAALGWIGVFAGIMITSALYLLLRTSNLNYADARYAYPAVIGLALMHGLVMKYRLQAGNRGAYRIGIYLSVTFAVLTVALFLGQIVGQ